MCGYAREGGECRKVTEAKLFEKNGGTTPVPLWVYKQDARTGRVSRVLGVGGCGSPQRRFSFLRFSCNLFVAQARQETIFTFLKVTSFVRDSIMIIHVRPWQLFFDTHAHGRGASVLLACSCVIQQVFCMRNHCAHDAEYTSLFDN